MLKYKLFALIVIAFSSCCLPVAFGTDSSELFSPSVAETFHAKAVRLYTDPNATMSDAHQAVVFLSAANMVDRQMGRILPDMVRLAWRFPNINIYDRIKPIFLKYAGNDDADLEVLRLGMQYLLEPLNFREKREQFFTRTLQLIGTRHKLFTSDITTQLGLLAAEGADMQRPNSISCRATTAMFITRSLSKNCWRSIPKLCRRRSISGIYD